MIVFDLACGNGHVFEAWFGSSADYDDQAARGLVACPMCNDSHVVKALMSPAIPSKGNRQAALPGALSDAAETGAIKAFMSGLADAQAKLEASSDYVGQRFAEEARAIHHGETESRSIYGEATRAEAVALNEEGVRVSPLPFRSRRAADA